MTSSLRQWWTGGSRDLLIKSQDVLIRNLVRAPASRLESSGGILNSVEFAGNPSAENTLVVAHGYGSGLGFFFRNIDALVSSNQYRRIVLFDWLGMGGSHRPGCHASPIRGWSEFTTSFCNSRFAPSEAVGFFIDPLHNFLNEHNIQNMTLVGHSLGGYLSAKYALQYPERIKKLVLASPVGFPDKPHDALPPSQLPTGLRVVDALWSSNVTPQQLVRMMGSTRGKRNVKRALRGRIPHLKESESDMLADYLYQVTVADPSGEYAINSLLEPVASPDTMGVFAREPLHKQMQDEFDSSTISLKVLFGSDDWMRRNNEESAREVVKSIQSSNAAAVASMHVIPNAGHHLYLDNSDSFVRHILS